MRPWWICQRCVWPDSFHKWTCCCRTLNNFYKKGRLSVTCRLATIIWSSSRLFTHQQITVRLLSLTQQSYLACIHLSYCYTRQKFGWSTSAGSFIAFISQSNAVGSRKNEPVWLSWHVFVTPCFLPVASFTLCESFDRPHSLLVSDTWDNYQIR